VGAATGGAGETATGVGVKKWHHSPSRIDPGGHVAAGADGVAVGIAVAGAGMAVGGTAVAVAGTAVAGAGADVAVGAGARVAVGAAGALVGTRVAAGRGVAVARAGTRVAVGVGIARIVGATVVVEAGTTVAGALGVTAASVVGRTVIRARTALSRFGTKRGEVTAVGVGVTVEVAVGAEWIGSTKSRSGSRVAGAALVGSAVAVASTFAAAASVERRRLDPSGPPAKVQSTNPVSAATKVPAMKIAQPNQTPGRSLNASRGVSADGSSGRLEWFGEVFIFPGGPSSSRPVVPSDRRFLPSRLASVWW